MPKKEMSQIDTDMVRSLLRRLMLPRKEVANRLGVSVNTIKKWAQTGKVPKKLWLDLLKLEQETTKSIRKTLVAELEEIPKSEIDKMILQPLGDGFSVGTQFSDDELAQMVFKRNLNLLPKASTEALVGELKLRGWKVMLSPSEKDKK